MSDPNLPNGEQPQQQQQTPLQPPSVTEPELTSQLPSDFQPGAAVPPPATTPLPPAAATPSGSPVPPAGAELPGSPVPPAPPAPPAGQVPPGYGAVPPQGPQHGYAPGGYPPVQPKGLAIAALIVGIASLVFFWFWILGLLGGIAAVILGILALRKRQSKGMSLTGIITGGVAVLASIGVLIFSLFVLGSVMNAAGGAMSDFDQLTEELETATPSPAPSDSPSELSSEGASDGASAGASEGASDASGDDTAGTGERSAEFCAALTSFSNSGMSTELTDEVLASLKSLADIESPNQSVYQRFYEYAQDPLSVDDSSTLISDYFDAVSDDAMACV